jgi:hypothetical protein
MIKQNYKTEEKKNNPIKITLIFNKVVENVNEKKKKKKM